MRIVVEFSCGMCKLEEKPYIFSTSLGWLRITYVMYALATFAVGRRHLSQLPVPLAGMGIVVYRVHQLSSRRGIRHRVIGCRPLYHGYGGTHLSRGQDIAPGVSRLCKICPDCALPVDIKGGSGKNFRV